MSEAISCFGCCKTPKCPFLCWGKNPIYIYSRPTNVQGCQLASRRKSQGARRMRQTNRHGMEKCARKRGIAFAA